MTARAGTGHVRARGRGFEYIVTLGSQRRQRCRGCGWKAWNTDLEECPKCGGPVVTRQERRQHSKGGFPTREDAEAALAEEIVSIYGGVRVDPTRVTVGEYLLDVWLPARKPKHSSGRRHRGQVGIGTWATYRSDAKAHVIPHVGAVRLQQLQPSDLNRLYDHLEASGGRQGQGLSPKTLANVHGMVHKALKDALRQGLVKRNVADAVDPPRAGKPDTSVWAVEQLRAYLTHVAEERLYSMWLLFATTGMRRGEVAGLVWPDLDLDAGRLRIDWTLGLVDARPTFKPRPKSKAGERTMALDPATIAALRAWRKRQNEERLAAGPAWVDPNVDWRGTERSELVFTWPDGSLINPDRITDWFHVHREAAKLPRIRPYDMRHTYATAGLANARGWHEVKILSERLGHASVGFTLDCYAHVLPAADREQADTLARTILGGAET